MSCQNCGDSFVTGFVIGFVIAASGFVLTIGSRTYSVWDDTGEIVIKANKEYYKLTKANDEEIIKYIKENK